MADDDVPVVGKSLELPAWIDLILEVLDRIRDEYAGEISCPVCMGEGDDPITGEADKCRGCNGVGQIVVKRLDAVREKLREDIRREMAEATKGTTPKGRVLEIQTIQGGTFTRKESRRLLIDTE